MNARSSMGSGANKIIAPQNLGIPQLFDRNLWHGALLGRTDRQKKGCCLARQCLIIQFGSQDLIYHARISLAA